MKGFAITVGAMYRVLEALGDQGYIHRDLSVSRKILGTRTCLQNIKSSSFFTRTKQEANRNIKFTPKVCGW